MVASGVVSDPAGHVVVVTYAAWSVVWLPTPTPAPQRNASSVLYRYTRTSRSSRVPQAVLVGLVLYCYCNYAVSMFAWCYADGDLDDLASFPSLRRDDLMFCGGWRHGSSIRSSAGSCPFWCTVMRRLTTGIRSEKCVVRQFRCCANVTQCTYTNLDSIAYCTARLCGIAYCC